MKKAILLLALLCACTSIGEEAVREINVSTLADTQAEEQACDEGEKRELPVAERQATTTQPLMECLYYDREQFVKAVANAPDYSCDGSVLAGLVPHHLLVSDMIAGFFAMASQSAIAYDTVVLLSPSHFTENCSNDIVTTSADWNTPFGKLQTNTQVTEKLIKNNIIAAEENRNAVEADHGAAGLIPFIRYFLPDADIAVCLLSNRVSANRLNEVQRVLGELCQNERVLLISSMDCSHYLMPEEAEQRDMQTRQAIETFDYKKLMSFNDANLDSPQVASAFLSVTQELELTLGLMESSSSAKKLPHAIKNPIFDEGITTYFVYAAYRK